MYPAHIRNNPDGTKQVQSVDEHNKNVSKIAGDCLLSIGLAPAGRLAGLAHDMGKNTEESRRYQNDAADGKPIVKGSVIHTFQGCRMILEQHAPTPTHYRDITSELLAFAAGAHHGLFDVFGPDRTCGFIKRIQKESIGYAEAKKAFLESIGGETEFDRLFSEADACLSPIYDGIDSLAKDNNSEDYNFYFSLLVRLILSAVIEGDRRDTAEFMNGSVFPDWPQDMRAIWRDRLRFMEGMLSAFPKETPIDRARRDISDLCRTAAKKPGGVFRLNVPTGGGKTLSALRYALAHAAAQNKRRIIFTSPLLSILDQNAKVLRKYIGKDDMILEHHSNVIEPETQKEDLPDRELLTQSWDSAIIITTLVQLLNTMFDGKTSSIRRFWALADSVIVIDEVQTVPGHLLSLFNYAVNFLSHFCRTTFVLCSATQPCLEEAARPLAQQPQEIVPYSEELWRPFVRTTLTPGTDLKMEQIPAFAMQVLQKTNSLLIVCNKKYEAQYLFEALKLETYFCCHLSASMCMEHRRQVLDELRDALCSCAPDQQVVCVSTQVIEAGVDISFGSVIRLCAGMDSVVQAAGRCNRNGESATPAPVYLLNCTDENLCSLREIQMGKSATIELMHRFNDDPGRYQNDLFSKTAIEDYYRLLWNKQKDGYADGPVPKLGTLFSLLSVNPSFSNGSVPHSDEFFLRQSFATAGKFFQVFDESSASAVAPWGEGEKLIAEAAAWDYAPDDTVFADWLQRVRPYTVTLYDNQKKRLLEEGMVQLHGVYMLQPYQYDMNTGVTTRYCDNSFLEV